MTQNNMKKVLTKNIYTNDAVMSFYPYYKKFVKLKPWRQNRYILYESIRIILFSMLMERQWNHLRGNELPIHKTRDLYILNPWSYCKLIIQKKIKYTATEMKKKILCEQQGCQFEILDQMKKLGRSKSLNLERQLQDWWISMHVQI